jgi:Na+/glutamate symporter
VKWAWTWTPTIRAEFGDNMFFDWVRVGCVTFGMVLLMVIGRILVESYRRRRKDPMPRTQAARFVALALAAVSINLTEVAVVGTPATPRLIVNIATLVFGFYGARGIRRKQKANPPPRHPRGRP